MPKQSALLGTLSASAFKEAAKCHPLLAAHTLAAAKQVLVYGVTTTLAAKDSGSAPQHVHRAAMQLARSALPEGWERVTVSLPSKLAKDVRQLEVRERARLVESGSNGPSSP